MATLQRTESNLIGYLQNGITSTDTTIKVVFYDKVSGLARTPDATTLLFVLDKGSPQQPNPNYEIILASSHSTALGVTIITVATNGRGLYFNGSSLTGNAANAKAHVASAEIGTADVHYLWNLAVNKLNGTDGFDNDLNLNTHTITGATTPISTETDHVANVDYVNNVVIAGGADASTTVKGISKLSKNPVAPSNPIAVGDNDYRLGFDAVVAPTGGDYTTLGAALSAGKKRIFVKIGTYTETAGIQANSTCYIQGESENSTVINVTQSFANFITCLEGITIKNIKFNITSSHTASQCFVYANPVPSVNMRSEVVMDNCSITITKTSTATIPYYALIGRSTGSGEIVNCTASNNVIYMTYGGGGTNPMSFYSCDQESIYFPQQFYNNTVTNNLSDSAGNGNIYIYGNTVCSNNYLKIDGGTGTNRGRVMFGGYTANYNNTCYARYKYTIQGYHVGGTYNMDGVADADFAFGGSQSRFEFNRAKCFGVQFYNNRNGERLLDVQGTFPTPDTYGSTISGCEFIRGKIMTVSGYSCELSDNCFLNLGMEGNCAVTFEVTGKFNNIHHNYFYSHQTVSSGTNNQTHTLSGDYNIYDHNILGANNDAAVNVPTVVVGGTGNNYTAGDNILAKF